MTTTTALRLPLSATNGSARGDPLKHSPRRKPLYSPPQTEYKPPEERLADAISECLQLDRELKVLENSGHARMGAFAKPFVTLQRNQRAADVTNLEDADDDSSLLDEECADPFFHQFYDDDGRSMFEQLLRCRMRVLALSKMVHGRTSLQYVRAELELAETYARINLWKQGHIHVSTASELLKELGAKLGSLNGSRKESSAAVGGSSQRPGRSSSLYAKALEHFYELQADEGKKGQVSLDALIEALQLSGDEDSPDQALPFDRETLTQVFRATTSPEQSHLHWQQLILSMERRSTSFREYTARLERQASESALHLLRTSFTTLDLTQDGVVPFHTFLSRLEGLRSSDFYLQALCVSLRAVLDRFQHHSLTWSEVLELGSSRQFFENAVQELWPRIKLFMGRLFLRRGQLEDAVRQVQLAIAQQELLFGSESESLVQFYLVIAEAMAVRFKQMGTIAQHSAFEAADKWLQSVEGSRALRGKAMELIDDECARSGVVLPKKEAESRSRAALLQEYSASSLVRPDAAMIEDAVEFCTKAWSLQESHCGREHISTAVVHVTLAQIYLLKSEPNESIRYFTKAIEIYENACNGPVPTSSFLRLEIAKLYQQHQQVRDLRKARELYEQVGDFFHSFAHEFAGSDSTKRECCVQVIEAFRQCLALSTHSPKDEQKQVLLKIFSAASDGFGECSMEASEAARELGALLEDRGNLKGAEKYLRTACYIVESHVGPTDRRYRRLRKEVLDVTSKLRASTLHPDESGHDDHAWLTL